MKHVAIIVLGMSAAWTAKAEEPRTTFEIRYVAADAVYLNAGRNGGLAEGFKLSVRRVRPGDPILNSPVIAELSIVSVAETSAVCEIKSKQTELQAGDTAILSSQDAEIVKLLQTSRSARKYAQVVSFSEGDPLEEEAREYVPRPPLPEVNRIRGRIGYEYSSTTDHITNNAGSVQQGIVLRADMTRINGSYWNFSGYWRGTINSRAPSSSQQTILDVLNRTYHIGLYYNNPESKYTMGFGRLLVPWANSLSTIDGGYFARRLNRRTIVAVFAGSLPDPSSWNYAPGRTIAGSLASYEAGTYDGLRYTGTVGLAITRRNWRAEREYVFAENSLLFKRKFAIFHNIEADRLTVGRLGNTQGGLALTRSFVTARYQPWRRLSLDVNHNYFRDVPTFDTLLIGIGLLDRLLFEGLSGGFRLDLPAGLSLYSTVGISKRQSDARGSGNRMLGVTMNNFAGSKARVDLRYSQFDSSFGRGQYYAGSFSRQLSDKIRIDFQTGKQSFQSSLTQQNRAIFFISALEYFLGAHYWATANYSIYRGRVQNYDQLLFTLGYRF